MLSSSLRLHCTEAAPLDSVAELAVIGLRREWCGRAASKHPRGNNRAAAGTNGAVAALLCRAPALRRLTLDFGTDVELVLAPPGVLIPAPWAMLLFLSMQPRECLDTGVYMRGVAELCCWRIRLPGG